MLPAGAALVAVDWGTTRLRAYLIGADGDVLDRAVAPESGVQSVSPGGFPAALEAACGHWWQHGPDLPVFMAGMVGSRNGWAEAAYVSPPCGPEALAAALLRVEGARPTFIVPGVDARGDDGSYDVMRGEETQVVGTGVRDGLVCLPGTHSKWVAVADGRVARFTTFITGELYAALSNSFVSRLAREPEAAEAGATQAAAIAPLGGGLSRTLFQARTQVLGGGLAPEAVKPFISHLLIESEIRGAADLFGRDKAVHLVAAPPQREPYADTLRRLGYEVTLYDPETTTVSGLVRLATAAGLLQPAFR